jgi:zinc protease
MCWSRWLVALMALMFYAPAHAALRVDDVRIAHGVRAWYVASDTVPVVDVQISFEGAGHASDPAGREGRAALAAAMLTEGAGNYDALAFAQAMEDGAIEISASSSADRLTIHVRALREQAMRAGELLALALREPRFAEEDLARVKAQVTTGLLAMEESPAYRSARLLSEHAFAGHPYANPPYGTAASIAALGAEDLRQFLSTYVTRSSITIAAAGDVDAALLDDVLDPVIDALGDNDAGYMIAKATMKGAGEQLRDTMPVPQTVVHFMAPGVARSDPRFYAASILNHALGGDGLISRLARAVRQDKGLVYSIGSSLDVRRGAPTIGGSFATRNAQAAEAIEVVKAVLRDIQQRGITAQECEDARTYVLNAQTLRLDSSADVATTVLAMQIHDLGQDYLDEREGYLTDVSCAEVNALATELLDPARFLFATVGGTDTP